MEGHNRLAPALYGIRTTPKVGLSYVGNVWDCSTFGGLQLSVWRGGRKAVLVGPAHSCMSGREVFEGNHEDERMGAL